MRISILQSSFIHPLASSDGSNFGWRQSLSLAAVWLGNYTRRTGKVGLVSEGLFSSSSLPDPSWLVRNRSTFVVCICPPHSFVPSLSPKSVRSILKTAKPNPRLNLPLFKSYPHIPIHTFPRSNKWLWINTAGSYTWGLYWKIHRKAAGSYST